MPLNEVGLVHSNTLGAPNWPVGLTNGANGVLDLDPSGAQIVMDFYLKAMLAGKGFQVRAGTITTPLVGDVVITDTAAEYCVDPGSGLVILPTTQMISLRLLTGTLHEYATKSVATASTAGTAFVPLPLLLGGAGPGWLCRLSPKQPKKDGGGGSCVCGGEDGGRLRSGHSEIRGDRGCWKCASAESGSVLGGEQERFFRGRFA